MSINWYGKQQRDNRVWLKRMMKHFGLTRKRVAGLLCVHVTTVDRWLMLPERKSSRKMPAMARTVLLQKAENGDFNNP